MHDNLLNGPHVKVSELLSEELDYLHLAVLSGETHLDNRITHPRVQKPGLAFAGYYPYIKPGRVQIIGESETEYLKTLPDSERQLRLDTIASLPVPVFIITKGIEPLPGFLASCQTREVPVLSSIALSSVPFVTCSSERFTEVFTCSGDAPTWHLTGTVLVAGLSGASLVLARITVQ